NHRAGRQCFFFDTLVSEELGHGLRNGLVQKRAGARVMIQQRLDFGAHLHVIAFTLKPSTKVGGLHIDSGLEQLADLLPLIARHRVPPLNSRTSHARGSAQRRLSVAGEIPSAVAASSMPRPTK